MTNQRQFDRRMLLIAPVASALAVAAPGRRAKAEEDEDDPSLMGEIPSTGGARSGPVQDVAVEDAQSVAEPEPEPEPAPRGVPPVAIQIERAGVDAVVERVQIVDGVMENPSGPWVVSWYEDLAAPGAGSNAVMSGHVDYWDVGPAVFQALETLVPGDVIYVYGEDDTVFEYAVEWMENVVVADLTSEDIGELVGDTEEESLTLITCKIGTFDEATGEYRERFVLRARGVS